MGPPKYGEALKKLQDGLSLPMEAKGIKFPKIKGPNGKDAR